MDTIGLNGLFLIKSHTPLNLTPIPNSYGSYYIGFNHLTRDNKTEISSEQANKLLTEDCQKYADYIDSLDIYLTQNQRDALISFSFDCGFYGLEHLLNESHNQIPQIADNIVKYIHSLDKRTTEDLYKRRLAERDLFTKTRTSKAQ